jgi:acetyl-CoA carboxylase biotin carboxyl carrier protein
MTDRPLDGSGAPVGTTPPVTASTSAPGDAADSAVAPASVSADAATSALLPADAGATSPATAAVPADAAGDASLLALLDRLAALLERSDLTELEVESGGTGLILRKPAALAHLATFAPPLQPAGSGQRSEAAAGTARSSAGSSGGSSPASASSFGASSGAGSAAAPAAAVATALAVRAPLTGIFYASPGPGSPPFVAVGREVVVGQVIGLIEAMKLFNEIKSDQAGQVVRVIAEDGALVKAKQPLIEVVPL